MREDDARLRVYDTQTRNLLIDAHTLTEVLDIIRATVRKYGMDAMATWLLMDDDDTDPEKGRRIASGEDLAQIVAGTPQEAAPHDD